jgi:hypothetical protein
LSFMTRESFLDYLIITLEVGVAQE